MINIHARVKHLIQKYGTRDPEKLARELKITIIKRPFKKTMGFFKKDLGKKFVIVNSNLDEFIQRLVLAHELGHALLHSSNQTSYIHEYTLFPRGRVEIEANKFAAELLIDEAEIDKCYLENMCTSQVASYFGVPKKLVEYKFDKYIIHREG
ncbi:ImmA/IrrE family metallo-endopeptidase [Clostridium kluyveri]|uniref:ImmA/IrrE family metallo-endopeptidase n=1 Tax=Clostridium kluyveri TaxID=1534 RepID=A0A1L5FBY4_CLOKL|nr:ImmA/IrrE family metallo-endopeptidase [Clostridium kluyveri]APM40519.1 ImmA/IrrE family metallo-endopeptidase [Clostridium kluyveri]